MQHLVAGRVNAKVSRPFEGEELRRGGGVERT